MPGPLDGIRVIDFGQYIAGPLAAVMLGRRRRRRHPRRPAGRPRLEVGRQTPFSTVVNAASALDLENARGLQTPPDG